MAYSIEDGDMVVSEFLCEVCGNRRGDCHQYVYGSFLVQEAVSLLQEREADEVTSDDVRHYMRCSYINHLNFTC